MKQPLNTDQHGFLHIDARRYNADELADMEWLLTNSRAGFSSGTIAGCNTRRYHGLITGSLNPPAERVVGISACLETILYKAKEYSFSCFEFDRSFHPQGFHYLAAFHRDIGVHWDYELPFAKITKSIYLLPDSDTAAIVYDFTHIKNEFDFSLRPFAAVRDYHGLQNAGYHLYSLWNDQDLIIKRQDEQFGKLFVRCDAMRFEQQPQWWHRFFYRQEARRGQDCHEDLWSPGVFACRIDKPQRLVFWTAIRQNEDYADPLEKLELEIVIDALKLRQKEMLQHCGGDPIQRTLFLASGQFVVERTISESPTPTVVAGYPWFVDWGRDTFISLEGLCLCTGRHAAAAGILQTFARAVSEGMIPNRFDDYDKDVHYNSIDASLWFVHAAFAYLRIAGDKMTFASRLLPAVKWIIDTYHRGTRFGIRADEDMLITGGSHETQLTWMDAKCGDTVFTPRYGKAVEINALWVNALRNLQAYYQDKNLESAGIYRDMADKAAGSFCKLFWNEQAGCLNDCILPDGTIDAGIRPNQIFAVSLPYSPLPMHQQVRVVQTVQEHLLTPFGLRTLSPKDSRYIGRYEGDGFQRDRAYHQGTVWPFLIGAFIEAYLRINDFSPQARHTAMKFLEPLTDHLFSSGCLGSISEIFDGDPPQQPKGCIAQAWSVAETLRAWTLIHSGR